MMLSSFYFQFVKGFYHEQMLRDFLKEILLNLKIVLFLFRSLCVYVITDTRTLNGKERIHFLIVLRSNEYFEGHISEDNTILKKQGKNIL